MRDLVAGDKKERLMERQIGGGLVFALGAGLVFFTLDSQTAAGLRPYLEKNGYSQVDVQAPASKCGKYSKIFPFKARSVNGQPVSGHVCAGIFEIFYSISENNSRLQ
jgi:hypothetical protein